MNWIEGRVRVLREVAVEQALGVLEGPFVVEAEFWRGVSSSSKVWPASSVKVQCWGLTHRGVLQIW